MKIRTLLATAFAVIATLTPFIACAQDATPAPDTKPAQPAQEAKPRGGKAAAAFAAADKDGDGKLNLAEFTEFSKSRLDADAAKARFIEIDTNSDGFISKEEMRAGMKGQGKKGGGEKKPAEGEKSDK
jgi:Ca2+-binding EF-hand superfamily protein